jgi:hypothetical protein
VNWPKISKIFVGAIVKKAGESKKIGPLVDKCGFFVVVA